MYCLCKLRKINFDYDIINFRKGDINEINIFNGKALEKTKIVLLF